MAANDWSNTTKLLLTGSPGTQHSFGDIRNAVGDPNKQLAASELRRVTDLDAPYQGGDLPYILDSTENVGVPTSGEISPDDVRSVIKEYCLEQDPNTEEQYFDVGTLSSPSTQAAVDWNSNLNKNITK